MAEPFARYKATADCLSAYDVSRSAADEGTEAERQRWSFHSAGCPQCAERLAHAREAQAAHAERPVPDWLRQPLPATRRWCVALPVTAAAAAAAALVIAILPSGPTERSKGGLGVSVSVQRDGMLVLDEVPLDEARALRPGNHLRLRVSGAPWVRVESSTVPPDSRYTTAARSPSDGWLPIGLTVTGGETTELRVIGCATEPATNDETGCKRLVSSF